MERIESSGKSRPYSTRKQSESGGPETSRKGSFFDAFSEARSVESAESGHALSHDAKRDGRDLAELLDDIYALGEGVKKNPGRETVLSYKEAVGRLVRLALSQSLRVEEQTSSPNILRQKRFTLVQVIDRKLDRLVSEVLMSQRGTMEILGRIDEINGLLVDLTS